MNEPLGLTREQIETLTLYGCREIAPPPLRLSTGRKTRHAARRRQRRARPLVTLAKLLTVAGALMALLTLLT